MSELDQMISDLESDAKCWPLTVTHDELLRALSAIRDEIRGIKGTLGYRELP